MTGCNIGSHTQQQAATERTYSYSGIAMVLSGKQRHHPTKTCSYRSPISNAAPSYACHHLLWPRSQGDASIACYGYTCCCSLTLILPPLLHRTCRLFIPANHDCCCYCSLQGPIILQDVAHCSALFVCLLQLHASTARHNSKMSGHQHSVDNSSMKKQSQCLAASKNT